MTGNPLMIGDWGTTHLSLALLNADTGTILDRLSGPGTGRLDGRSPADVMIRLLTDWRDRYAAQDLLLCGTVGSNIGWSETPYLSCPTPLDRLYHQALRFEHDGLSVRIVPGLSCINPLGIFDTMRGEETQLLGWLSQQETLDEGSQIVCLPGTHTKWVAMDGPRVTQFTSSIPGEMFAALKQYSVMISSHLSGDDFHESAFREGVRNSLSYPDAILSLINSARALTLNQRFSNDEAADYLSGLLIGSDVGTANKYFPLNEMQKPVPLIGSDALMQRYTIAMRLCDLDTRHHNGTDMAFQGLIDMISEPTT